MEALSVERSLNFIQSIRKTLLFGIITLILAMTARAYWQELKFDIKYLQVRKFSSSNWTPFNLKLIIQDSYNKLRIEIENTSLIESKGIGDYPKQLEFKEWSQIEMEKVSREIQSLSDNVKLARTKSGIKEGEDTRFDLALYSAGGSIASVYNTRLLDECSVISLLIGACRRRHPPENVIKDAMNPGQCFCFQGNQGDFTIRMACEAVLNGVTIEHIPQSMTATNDISSAPKIFNLTGLKDVNDKHGFSFGTFEFEPTVESKKYFKIPKKSEEKFQLTKVSVSDNHGNADETCMYRIQLHGFVEKC